MNTGLELFIIHPSVIMTGAVITAILCIITIVIYYHKFVPIHWIFFLAMAVGAGVIGWFQFKVASTIIMGGNVISLMRISPLIFCFILLSTCVINISAILYHRIVTRPNERT